MYCSECLKNKIRTPLTVMRKKRHILGLRLTFCSVCCGPSGFAKRILVDEKEQWEKLKTTGRNLDW